MLLTVIGLVILAAAAEARPVTATWDANTDDFTVGYRLFYGLSSQNYGTSIDVGNVTTFRLDLLPGATYFFVVRGYSARGVMGDPSNEASITLTNAAPTVFNPGDVAVPAGPISVAVPASDPDGDALSFAISGFPRGVTINPSTGVLSGFMYPAGTYNVTITTTDGVASAQSSFRLTVAGTACPGPPAAPTLATPVVSGNQVSLSWTPPSTGIEPVSYVVQAGSTPGQSNIATVDLGAALTISAAVGNGQYFVRVAGRNACGDAASNEQSFVIGPPPPGAPTGLAFSIANGVVTLTWSAPATGTPTSYVIEAGSASGLSNLLPGFNTGSANRSFSAQAPPGRYFVRVRAQNQTGLSTPSNEVVINVP